MQALHVIARKITKVRGRFTETKQCGFEHWPAEYLGKTQKKLFCLTSWIIRERDWLLPRKLQAILVLVDWNTKCNHNQTELKKDKHPSYTHWCNIKRRQFLGWKTKLTVSSDHCSFHSGDNLKLSTDGRNSLYRLLQCLKTSRYVKQLKLENMITQKLFIVFTFKSVSWSLPLTNYHSLFISFSSLRQQMKSNLFLHLAQLTTEYRVTKYK